tara:strand:+ start:20 stop:334 length:315 start_codon:yes stop_codon:yes gene_type:complete
MAQTVAECLTAATDSVTVINDINSNGNKSRYAGGQTDADGNAVAGDWEQVDINACVQRNVDHLEIILAYDGENNTPNVVGSSSSKKTTCSTAITTGKAYISSNS